MGKFGHCRSSTMFNAKSPSAKLSGSRPRRVAVGPGKTRLTLLDQDAIDALEFAQRGRPDAEIGYSEEAPRLAPEQLAEFEPASFRFTRRK